MAGAARRWLESVLILSGLPRAARALHLGPDLVLAYHNVLPDSEPQVGERSLHLPLRTFLDQLDMLGETADVVSLATLLAPEPTDRRGRKPRVAITFDDAYRGAVCAGVPALVQRGFPATIFVPPDFIGSDETFWWDALADPTTGTIRPELRAAMFAEFGGETRAIRRWAASADVTWTEMPPYALPAGRADLEAAERHPEITLASHTWSHVDLTRVDDATRASELRRPLEWLRAFPAARPWLAYPYGHWSLEVAAATRDAGYEAAFCVGDVRKSGRSEFARPRLNVPDRMTANGLALRISGLPAPRRVVVSSN